MSKYKVRDNSKIVAGDGTRHFGHPQLQKLGDVLMPPDMKTADTWTIEWSELLQRFTLVPHVKKIDLDLVELESLLAVMRNGMIRDTLPEPPSGSVLPGSVFVVSENPTGAWAAEANKLAIHNVSGKWIFESPQLGNTHYHDKLRRFVKWDGTKWVASTIEEYERTNVHAGLVRDVDGRVFGIGGANGIGGHTGATLEFMFDANSPSTASTKILLHDCSEIDFGQAGTIRGVVDPSADDAVANKKYVDAKVASVVTGISHGVAVESITNTPPSSLFDGNSYIVGPAPTGAWVGKANVIATAHSGSWLFVSPHTGDTHLNEADKSTYSWNGTTWVKTADSSSGAVGPPTADALPVGAILMWPTASIPANYLELNGSTFDAVTYPDLYRALGSDKLPDFRGQFVRGAQPGNAALTKKDWSTGKPRTTDFTTDSQGNHIHTADSQGNHKHVQGYRTTATNYYEYGWKSLGKTAPVSANSSNWPADLPYTSTDGAHSHNISEAGAHSHAIVGGDAETAPTHVYAVYIIKANP